MDPRDLRLRRLTYRLIVELGRAPTAAETAAAGAMAEAGVARGWQRLHDQHALVLDAETAAIRMANPFSAVPTPYRVLAGGRSWHANCAWDAFGTCAALHVDGRIETSCADCGDALHVAVVNRLPDDESRASIASFPRTGGGTTSSSPEAR